MVRRPFVSMNEEDVCVIELNLDNATDRIWQCVVIQT